MNTDRPSLAEMALATSSSLSLRIGDGGRRFTQCSTVLSGLLVSFLLLVGCDKDGAPSSAEVNPESSARASQVSASTSDQAEHVRQEIPQNSKDAQKNSQPTSAISAQDLPEGTPAQMALLYQGKEALFADRLAQAEALFSELSRTGPLSGAQVSAVLALGQIYETQGHHGKAEKLYRATIEKAPALAEIQLVLARQLQKKGGWKESRDAYLRALSVQPYYIFIWAELGQLYARHDQSDASAKAFLRYETEVYRLAKALENEETPPAEKLEILDVFSLIDDDRATQAVLTQLKARHSQVRKQAVHLLGEIPVVAARPELENVLQTDPDSDVRLAAKTALQSMQGIRAPAEDDTLGPTKLGSESDSRR